MNAVARTFVKSTWQLRPLAPGHGVVEIQVWNAGRTFSQSVDYEPIEIQFYHVDRAAAQSDRDTQSWVGRRTLFPNVVAIQHVKAKRRLRLRAPGHYLSDSHGRCAGRSHSNAIARGALNSKLDVRPRALDQIMVEIRVDLVERASF